MSRRQIIFAALALILLTCVAYMPVLNGSAGYIWDDNTHVTANPALHDGQGLVDLWAWGPRAVFDKTTKPATQQYYPVTFSSFWLEYQMWGLNPLGYHITNVALHLVCAFLLWIILRRLGFSDAISFFAAALFAVHPVNVESVAWISERKNTLSLVLYLASGYCWIRWSNLDEAAAGGADKCTVATRDFAWLFWATLLFTLALLAKSVTATLPVALFIVAWWKRGKVRGIDMVGLVPLFVVALAAGALTAFIEAHYIGAYGPDFVFPFPRVLIAGRAIWFYLASVVYPHNLVFIYPHWQFDVARWQAWIAPAAVIVIVAILAALHKRMGRAPLAVALLFIISLAPALGFINFYPMQFSFVADHFQYIAMIFICVGIAALLACMTSGCSLGTSAPDAAISSRLFVFLATAILLLLAAQSYQQSKIYHDEQTLYRATLAANPDAWMAAENLAVLLVLENPEKNYPEVIRLYRQTLEKNPRDAKAQSALAGTLLATRQYPEAEVAFRRALVMTPNDLSVQAGLAAALLVQNKFDEAMERYAMVVAREPNNPEYLAGEGNALLHAGHPVEAEKRFRAALGLHTGSSAVYQYYLGLALRDQGRLGPALDSFHKAIELNPKRIEPFVEMGDILARLHKDSMAVEYFQSALHLQPDYLPALLDLARLLLISDEPGRADPLWAADLFRQADEETHNQNLGIKIERASALAAAKFYDQAADLLQEGLSAADPQQVPAEDREHILQLIQKYQLEASPVATDTSAGAPVVQPDEYSIFQPYPTPPGEGASSTPASPHTTHPFLHYLPPP